MQCFDGADSKSSLVNAGLQFHLCDDIVVNNGGYSVNGNNFRGRLGLLLGGF